MDLRELNSLAAKKGLTNFPNKLTENEINVILNELPIYNWEIN